MGFRSAFNKLGTATILTGQATGELLVATSQVIGLGAVVDKTTAAARGAQSAVVSGVGCVSDVLWRALRSPQGRRTLGVAGTAALSSVVTLTISAVAGPFVGAVAGAVTGAATGQTPPDQTTPRA